MNETTIDAGNVSGEQLFRTSTGQYRAYLSQRISGTVSWFNPQKGYGFIKFGGDLPDAHLPLDVVEAFGRQTIYKESVLDCEVTVGTRAQVVRIYGMDDTDAVIPLHKPKPPITIERETEGIVKFFKDDEQGYGFIETDQGDVFVHITGVHRSGLETIHEGERYMCGIGRNERGTIVLELKPLEDDDSDDDGDGDVEFDTIHYGQRVDS